MDTNRVRRLITFPWSPKVEATDLARATYDELYNAVHLRGVMDDSDDSLIQSQKDKLLDVFITVRTRTGNTPKSRLQPSLPEGFERWSDEDQESYLQNSRADHYNREFLRSRNDDWSFHLIVEASEIDRDIPLYESRLDQVEFINMIDPENLRCEFLIEDRHFCLYIDRPVSYLALKNSLSHGNRVAVEWMVQQLEYFPCPREIVEEFLPQFSREFLELTHIDIQSLYRTLTTLILCQDRVEELIKLTRATMLELETRMSQMSQ